MVLTTCLICKKKYKTYPYYLKRGQIYCSSKCYGKSKIGKPTWNKNKSKSEFPQLSNTGVKKGHIPWNKGNRSKQAQTNREMRSCADYKIWRKAVLERDKYKCKLCNQIDVRLHANHIKKFADYLDLRFKVDNGITLCVPCHKKITGKEEIWEKVLITLLLST